MRNHPHRTTKRSAKEGSTALPQPNAANLTVKLLKPVIPAAFDDGLVPVAALDPELVVHAPIDDAVGALLRPGDLFDLLIDGMLIGGTTVAFPPPEDAATFLELKIAKAFIDLLADGDHALSYRVTIMPTGEIVDSSHAILRLDRVPVGGRCLPPITFDEAHVRDGLSLATLLTLPDASLRGVIPDYVGVDPRDTIHLFIKGANAHERLVAGTLLAETDGTPIAATFPRQLLELIEGVDHVAFYYEVVDAAGLRSSASPHASLKVSINSAPPSLLAPIVMGADDGIVTDSDIRPGLAVLIPGPITHAKPGDSIQLLFGDLALPEYTIMPGSGNEGFVHTFVIDYDTLHDFIDKRPASRFIQEVQYVHRRQGVVSRSATVSCMFDLSLPGGRDPEPATAQHEALPTPILRGSAGGDDNVVNLVNSSLPAVVHIVGEATGIAPISGLARGDTIKVRLGSSSIGLPHVYDGTSHAVAVSVPSSELMALSVEEKLTYTVERQLDDGIQQAVSVSMPRKVRILTKIDLPGGNSPLSPAVFVEAALREGSQGVYGLTLRDLSKGTVSLRIDGYTNMSVGDAIQVSYQGYDAFEGGSPISGATGCIRHIVCAEDLVAKGSESSQQSPGSVVSVDVALPSEIFYTVAFGRVETSYVIGNVAGEVACTNRAVLVNARRT